MEKRYLGDSVFITHLSTHLLNMFALKKKSKRVSVNRTFELVTTCDFPTETKLVPPTPLKINVYILSVSLKLYLCYKMNNDKCLQEYSVKTLDT